MFADDCNHLVPHYYDAEDNALTQELAADLRRLGGAAYANPPYSRPCTDSEGNPITGMEAILNYCREQRALGAKIMLLIKAATSETWWPEDADFIQFISGRIGFEVPSWYVPRDPKKDKPSSSGFASAVVIFDAGWQGERRPEARLRRDDLITTGTIILDMIHRQAVELTLAADHVIRNATPKLTPVVTQEQPAETEPAAGSRQQPTITRPAPRRRPNWAMPMPAASWPSRLSALISAKSNRIRSGIMCKAGWTSLIHSPRSSIGSIWPSPTCWPASLSIRVLSQKRVVPPPCPTGNATPQ
ncbi:DNA N-6-adenine-methyltransferase [Aeromonas caviae]|uniref:DNA N-6-adenine-methyltransferase n=1 Tax=Aeromonas caviae TaxID=648 RepID=UPI001F4F0D87|nr:DNA N-6-adenine-methyltransferase [Aeromonas caviae]